VRYVPAPDTGWPAVVVYVMSGPKICESCEEPFEPWEDEYGDPEDMCKYCSLREDE